MAAAAPGLIPLWAGEGDLPTPDFISEAATRRSRRRDLLHLAARHSRACARRLPATTPGISAERSRRDEFLVTGSGMQAIQLAMQAIAGAGDEVIVPDAGLAEFRRRDRRSPARARLSVPLDSSADGWHLDLDRPRGGRHAAHPRDLRQLAVQPDRLDRRSRRPCRRSSTWRAAATCGSSLTRSTRRFLLRRRPRALLPRHHGAGRPHPVRQHLLEELGDDRLAHRLDRGAAGAADRCSRT